MIALDMEHVTTRPVPRVVLGPLRTATQIRCAFRRLGQAVLDAKITPKVAGSAAYCVAGAARALELETAERIGRQLEALSEVNTHQRVALTHQPSTVLEGELVPR